MVLGNAKVRICLFVIKYHHCFANIIIILRPATGSSRTNRWTRVSTVLGNLKVRICVFVIKYHHYFTTCNRIFNGEYADAREYGFWKLKSPDLSVSY